MSRERIFEFFDKRKISHDCARFSSDGTDRLLGLDLRKSRTPGRLRDGDILLLAALVAQQPDCASLNLNGQTLANDGVTALTRLMAGHRFTHLHLQSIFYQKLASLALARATVSQPDLIQFSMNFNSVTSAEIYDVAHALAENLKENRNLAYLRVNHSTDHLQSFVLLAEVLWKGGNQNLSIVKLGDALLFQEFTNLVDSNFFHAARLAGKLVGEPGKLTLEDLEEILPRRHAIALMDDRDALADGHEKRQVSVQAASKKTQANIIAAASEGRLPESLLEAGKPTGLLLAAAAFGLLPQLAAPALWKERPTEGFRCWHAIRNALPRVVRAEMDLIDITVLSHAAGMPPPLSMLRHAARPKLDNGVRR